MATKSKWELAGNVKSNKYRLKALETLFEGIKTPNELRLSIKLSMPHTSRALKELADLELAECKNPKSKKGRLYKITKLGRDIIKMLK